MMRMLQLSHGRRPAPNGLGRYSVRRQPRVIGDQVLRGLLELLGKQAKHDRSFKIDDSISDGALARFSTRRALMMFRGLALSARTGHLVCPVFVGRGGVVTDAPYLSLSPGVTIEDYCRLDCLGRAGIALGRGTTLRRGVHIEVSSNLKNLAF